jgi:hypothetical protein
VANTASTAILIAMAAAERRVMDQLRGAGATSHERATRFVPARRGDERWLEGLLDRGVVVEASPGRYWLNERTQRSRASKKRVLLVIALALLAFALGAILLGAGL